VNSLDRDLLLIRPGPAEIAGRPGQDRARHGIDEQLGDRTFGQPPAIVVDDGDDAWRLAFDRQLARPAQRGAAVFTCGLICALGREPKGVRADNLREMTRRARSRLLARCAVAVMGVVDPIRKQVLLAGRLESKLKVECRADGDVGVDA
jgi:hypothetical protein